MEDDGGGEFTCVQREWRLEKQPDLELTHLAAIAHTKVATVVLGTAERLGAHVRLPEFQLGDPNVVQYEIYNYSWVKEQFETAKVKKSDK